MYIFAYSADYFVVEWLMGWCMNVFIFFAFCVILPLQLTVNFNKNKEIPFPPCLVHKHLEEGHHQIAIVLGLLQKFKQQTQNIFSNENNIPTLKQNEFKTENKTNLLSTLKSLQITVYCKYLGHLFFSLRNYSDWKK